MQARLVRNDGVVRTTVIRFAHLFTPGVGAGFVATIEDITERLAFEARLAHQANHDPLTGLPNRTLLARLRGRAVPPGHRRAGLPVPGPGQLQGRQRLPRPHRRRRAARRGRRPAARDGAPRRPGRPLRRRRVRRRLRAGGRGRRRRPRRAHHRRAGRGRCAWAGSTSARTPASASPCRPPSTSRRRSSSATATSRCTRPRPAARAGSPCSTRQARAEARDKLRLVAELRDAIERREHHAAVPADLRHRRPARRPRWRRWPGGSTRARADQPDGLRAAGRGERPHRRPLGLLVLDETCRQLAEWDRLTGPRRAAPGQRQRLGAAAGRQPARPGRWPPCERHGLHPRGISIEITESALMKDPDVGADGAAAAARPRRASWPSTTSAPATPRWPTCGTCRSTASRSTAPSSPSSPRGTARSPRRSSRWPAASSLCTVAEGVETAEQAAELGRLGATYLQGFSLAAAHDRRPAQPPGSPSTGRPRRDRHTLPASPWPAAVPAPAFDVETVLASIDTMAAQKPVAAQLVSVANAEDTSARELARHPRLRRRAGRPGDEAGQLRLLRHARPGHLAAVRGDRRRLHHGAHHGDRRAHRPRRRVAAARELLGLHHAPRARGVHAGAPLRGAARRTRCASACSPSWASRCCTTTTPRATGRSLAAEPTFPGRRAAETRRYGIYGLRLTARRAGAVGLPAPHGRAADAVDDYRAPEGALLRSSFELAARLTSRATSRCRSCGSAAGSSARTTSSRCSTRSARTPTSSAGRCSATDADPVRDPDSEPRSPIQGRGRRRARRLVRGADQPVYGAPSGSTVG